MSKSLGLFLVSAMLCCNSAWSQFQRHNVPTDSIPTHSLIPVMCLLLGLLVLGMCLVGFTLLCLSTFSSSGMDLEEEEEEGEETVSGNEGGGGERAGNDLAKKFFDMVRRKSYEKEDPALSLSSLAVAQEDEEENEEEEGGHLIKDHVILNMTPYCEGEPMSAMRLLVCKQRLERAESRGDCSDESGGKRDRDSDRTMEAERKCSAHKHLPESKRRERSEGVAEGEEGGCAPVVAVGHDATTAAAANTMCNDLRQFTQELEVVRG